MKRFSLILAAVLLSASASFVGAQVQTENRSVTGRPDTDVQIGVYVNVNPDCTSHVNLKLAA
jgi:hypothetical protein